MPRSSDPLVNQFSSNASSPISPAQSLSLVAPNDAADLPVYAKALRVYNPGGDANIRITCVGEINDTSTVDITVTAGLTVELVAVRRVWLTGTAAGLVIHAYLG